MFGFLIIFDHTFTIYQIHPEHVSVDATNFQRQLINQLWSCCQALFFWKSTQKRYDDKDKIKYKHHHHKERTMKCVHHFYRNFDSKQ